MKTDPFPDSFLFSQAPKSLSDFSDCLVRKRAVNKMPVCRDKKQSNLHKPRTHISIGTHHVIFIYFRVCI